MQPAEHLRSSGCSRGRRGEAIAADNLLAQKRQRRLTPREWWVFMVNGEHYGLQESTSMSGLFVNISAGALLGVAFVALIWIARIYRVLIEIRDALNGRQPPAR